MLNICKIIFSLVEPSVVAQNFSNNISLSSQERQRLLRHESLAISNVDREICIHVFQSLSWAVAGSPLPYPSCVMFEKAKGLFVVSENIYCLPLFQQHFMWMNTKNLLIYTCNMLNAWLNFSSWVLFH